MRGNFKAEEKVPQCDFSIDQFKSNDIEFEFYTGFSNYGTCKAFYNYLCPACERLQYIGSSNSSNQTAKREKCGPKRRLSPEDKLFLHVSYKTQVGVIGKGFSK